MTPLKDAIADANTADKAYEAAVQAAGFKSRWDYFKSEAPPALRAAYRAKVTADAIVHAAFAQQRKRA